MTVNTSKITTGPYIGNNIADTFSYGFRIKDKDQLSVYKTTDAGVETLLTVDTDYTVNGVGVDQGGTIILTAGALPTDYTLYIRADYKKTQLTAFQSQGAFFPDLHEDAMDQLTFLVQQVCDGLDRSPRLPDSYTGDLPLSLEAPGGGQYLTWNPAGTGLVNAGAPGVVIPQEVSANVSGMISNLNLVPGDYVQTKGYFNEGDNGHAGYVIKTVSQASSDGDVIDGYGNHTLANGHVAILLINGNEVNAASFGVISGDITLAIQTMLTIHDNIFIPEGIYTTSSVIVINEGQTIRMAGGGGTHLIEVDKLAPQFDHWDERVKGAAVITPIHQGFAFSMYSSSTLKGGFIDCRTMQDAPSVGDGGAIILDASAKTILDVNIDEVNLVAEWKYQGTHQLVGIYMECNDGGAAVSQAIYQCKFNVGVSGFIIAHHLHRTDAYPNIGAGLTWCTGMQIRGTVYLCNRATWFETNNNSFAGGSSLLEYDYQGSSLLPDMTAAVVEFSGDDIQCNVRWFDVVGSPGQEFRYKFKDALTPLILDTTPSNSDLIVDETAAPYRPIYTYIRPGAYDESLFEAASIAAASAEQMWWQIADGLVTIQIKVIITDRGAGWEKLMTLPYRCARITNAEYVTTSNENIALSCLGNTTTLNYINNTGGNRSLLIQITYPIE